MKKYIVYEWVRDDEAGHGVCLASEYTPNFDNENTYKLGEFNTIEELANIFYSNFPEFYANIQEALQEAKTYLKE